jgi:signal transduction histidine kinase
MIWTAAAVHVLPVTLLDVVVSAFLFQTAASAARRDRGGATARATTWLAWWGVALTFTNGGHVATCIFTDPRASFIANVGIESSAVLWSVLPLCGFAYLFGNDAPSRAFVVERRAVLALLAAAAAVISGHYLWRAFMLDETALVYRVAVEHTESGGEHFEWGVALYLVVLGGYAQAALVFVRQGVRAGPGRARGSALAFAGVVAAAVVAVVINRLEGSGILPMASYAAWTLGTMLVAVVTFMSHSELTSFAERIVGITLALVLIALAAAGELTVKMRADGEDRVRIALMGQARELWNEGKRTEALRVTGAVHADAIAAGAPKDDELAPHTIADAEIDEDFVADDGHTVRFAFSRLAYAEAIAPVAAHVAFGMIAAALLCSLLLRRVFEKSVLAPLRALERADASSRAKSMFIAQLSHELRTPLSAVAGHAHSLEQSVGDDVARARAHGIGEAAEHLLALVEGLIEESKADLSNVVARKEEVQVRALVRASIDLVRPRIVPGVAIVDDIDASVPAHIVTDPRFVRQVLLNLVTNAAKNTERGSIVCRVKRAAPGVVRFSVVDTGVGIAQNQIDAIFAPFHQVRGGEGAGLGLTIAQRLAEALGTAIGVESEPGKGSHFWFDLAAPDQSVAGPVEHADILVPDDPVLGELKDLALLGDLKTLRKRARALAEDDERYRAFAGRVDTLAESYQVRALQALLGAEER